MKPCPTKHYLGPKGPSDILLLHLVGPGAECVAVDGGFTVRSARLPRPTTPRPTIRAALEGALAQLDAAGSRLPCDPRPVAVPLVITFAEE